MIAHNDQSLQSLLFIERHMLRGRHFQDRYRNSRGVPIQTTQGRLITAGKSNFNLDYIQVEVFTLQ